MNILSRFYIQAAVLCFMFISVAASEAKRLELYKYKFILQYNGYSDM